MAARNGRGTAPEQFEARIQQSRPGYPSTVNAVASTGWSACSSPTQCCSTLEDVATGSADSHPGSAGQFSGGRAPIQRDSVLQAADMALKTRPPNGSSRATILANGV